MMSIIDTDIEQSKKMSRLWLIDAGHGGIDPEGIYVTDPNFNPEKPGAGIKAYAHKNGVFVREGEFNRAVRDELFKLINQDGTMKWKSVNQGYADTSLPERVQYINMIHRKFPEAVMVSIHGNAGGGKGFEVYTSKGETESDKIADVWIEEMEKQFPKKVNRGEKDRNFYLLHRTTCPAILTESFFMDTLKDCKIMISKEGQQKVALAIFNMMKRVDEGL